VSVDQLLAPSRAEARAAQADVEPAARIGALTLWRAAIALSAVTGVGLAALRYDVWWTALSQLASIAVFVAYAGFAAYPHLVGGDRHEPASPWLRGALATLMVLVAGAFLVMTGGDLSTPYSVFEHLVTPALVVADFLFVGSNQHGVRWWHPLTWLLPPAAYLCWYVAGDLQVYVALDPARRTEFVAETVTLAGFVLATGALLCEQARRRRRRPVPEQ